MSLWDEVDDLLKPPVAASSGAGRSPSLMDEVDQILDSTSEKAKKPARTRGRVRRVIDGDTVDVEGVGRVRLLGLDTPETYGTVEAGGPRATRYLKNLAEGKDVDVEISGDERDKYGRSLAHVYAEGGRVSLAAEMLDTGLASGFPGATPARPPISLRDGEAAAAAAKGALAGMVKGLIYPVSAFVPSYYKRLDEQILESRSTVNKFMQAKGIGDETTRRWVSSAPGFVGELVGGLVPGIGAYSAARSAFGVAQAATLASKAGRTLGAAAASGTAISAAAYLDDGESRLAHVAYNTAIAGAFETLGLPLLRRAWKQEVREAAATKIIDDVSDALGLDKEAADEAITAIRAGVAPKDVEVADTIVRTIAERHPDAVGSTVDLQAKKVVDAWVTRILPEKPPTVDASLRRINPNYGVSFDVVVGDQRMPKHIESSKIDTGQFGRQLQELRQKLYESSATTDVPVRLDNIRVHSMASYNRFVNFLYGRDGSGAPPLRTVPGAAPEGSLAYTGNVPPEGDHVVHIPTGRRVTIVPQGPMSVPPETPTGGVNPRLRAAELPKPETSLPESVRSTFVWVKDDQGKSERVKLSDIRPYLDLARPVNPKPLLSQFRPHPNGLTRHGLINLKEGKIDIEPAGDTSQGYFRDRLFFAQDRDSYLSDPPRLFVHADSVTIALKPVERSRAETLWGKRLEVGPQDSIAARQHVPYNETQLQAADLYNRHGAAVRTRPENDRFYLRRDYETGATEVRGSHFDAGFAPRKARSEVLPGEPPLPSEYGDVRAETLDPLSVSSQVPPKVTAQGRRPYRTPGSLVYLGPSYQVPKDALNNPHLVTARDSARILLKKGMSPDTRVNIRVTPGTYAYAPEETPQWTLRDLVNLEFGLTDLSSLQEEAAFRGLRVTPKGRGVIVEALDGSYRREFSQQLEAVEAIGRIPLDTRGVKLEAELERAWGYGFERSFDADVDSDVFRPIELQQSGIGELLQGTRPLVTVWSKSGDNLTSTVDALAKRLGLDPSAFNILELPGGARGRSHFAIYNRTAVTQALGRFSPALEHIGVKHSGNVVDTLTQLAGKKHGLSFLYGGRRDPLDQLLYTFLRERGEKELWSRAPVELDNLGPYRVFSQGIRDEIKQRNLRGRGVPQADPALPIAGPLSAVSDGPVGGNWKDLKDEVALPDDFYFTPRDADGPPPMAEPEVDWEVPDADVPGGGGGMRTTTYGGDEPHVLKDESSPISKVWNRFRVPAELFKSLEKNTNIPFYQWFSAIEMGRANVEADTKVAFGEISKLGRRLTKEDRKRVQLLLETKHSDVEAYKALSQSVSPVVRETADRLEGMYYDFFDRMEYKREDVAKMLGHFPHVRAAGGDYKVWVRGRTGLPKPMVDLSNDFGAGVINLDERDLDFTTLARRVFRASANAKHLRPVWDDVDHALKIFSHSRGNSTEFTNYFNYFDQYRREAMHLPDGLATSLDNFVQQSWKTIFKKELPKNEAADLVGTLTSFNYYANMGFQVGMVARNYLQTLQTTYPAIGAEHTASAVRWALKWRKDTKLQEEMLRRGVITRDAYIEPLRDVQRMVVESNAAGRLGDAPAKVMDALDYGVRWYQTADNFNRVVAFRAQFTKAKSAADAFLEKKISWTEFVRRSGGNRLVEDWNSGNGLQIKDALSQGNSDLAATVMGLDFARASQFVYSRGNVPHVLQSTLGRLLGQYGTWPSYYIEFLANGARRGTPGERVEFAARWAAANTAIYGGLGAAFGADFSRWTFFAPTSYTGGPVAQGIQQAMEYYKISVTGEDDPVSKIQSQRLQRFATTQILPVPAGAIRNYWQALDALGKENYGDFVRRTMGLPKAEE